MFGWTAQAAQLPMAFALLKPLQRHQEAASVATDQVTSARALAAQRALPPIARTGAEASRDAAGARSRTGESLTAWGPSPCMTPGFLPLSGH